MVTGVLTILAKLKSYSIFENLYYLKLYELNFNSQVSFTQWTGILANQNLTSFGYLQTSNIIIIFTNYDQSHPQVNQHY